jgi:hypothetical protein
LALQIAKCKLKNLHREHREDTEVHRVKRNTPLLGGVRGGFMEG